MGLIDLKNGQYHSISFKGQEILLVSLFWVKLYNAVP